MIKHIIRAIVTMVVIGFGFTIISTIVVATFAFITLSSAINPVVRAIANEGCLASDSIYLVNGEYRSNQDSFMRYIETVDRECWYLEFDTSRLENVVELETESGKSALSYSSAVDRGEVVNITIHADFVMNAAFLPDGDESALFLRLPITYSVAVQSGGYYKGIDDTRRY